MQAPCEVRKWQVVNGIRTGERLVRPLVVAAGGAMGAGARWGLGEVMSGGELWREVLVLLTVNTLGSLILGAVVFVTASGARELLRLGLGVGFCGGLTTFSTFAVLTLDVRDSSVIAAVGFVVSSVVLAVAAVMSGAWLAQRRTV